MSRTPITDAGAADLEGDGYYSVIASTADGNNFVLPHSFVSEETAKVVAGKVASVGSIDAARWVFWRTTYGSAAFEVEESEACLYAKAIQSGALSEQDPSIPESIKTLL
jgi:hypothetical protein